MGPEQSQFSKPSMMSMSGSSACFLGVFFLANIQKGNTELLQILVKSQSYLPSKLKLNLGLLLNQWFLPHSFPLVRPACVLSLSLCGSKNPWGRLLASSQALFWWMSLRNIIHLYFLKHWGVRKDVGTAPVIPELDWWSWPINTRAFCEQEEVQ